MLLHVPVLCVEMRGNNNDADEIRIIDVNGKNVMSLQLGNNKTGTITVAKSDLPPGIYSLALLLNNQIQAASRLVITR